MKGRESLPLICHVQISETSGPYLPLCVLSYLHLIDVWFCLRSVWAVSLCELRLLFPEIGSTRPPSAPQRDYILILLAFFFVCFCTLTDSTGWLMLASIARLCLPPSHWYSMLSLLIGLLRRTTQTGGGRTSCWHFRGNVTFNVWLLFCWRWQETKKASYRKKRVKPGLGFCLLKVFALFFFFTDSSGEHETFPYQDWCRVPDKPRPTKVHEPGPVSHHHSLQEWCFFFFFFFFFQLLSIFYEQSLIPAPTPIHCCTREVIFRAHLIV